MGYFVIGDKDMVLGFSFAGISGKEVQTREEAVSVLQHVQENRKINIILITERLAQLIREEVDKIIETMDFPLILEIPDRHGPIPGKKTIKEIVKAAVGI